jgi:hypothetical protein
VLPPHLNPAITTQPAFSAAASSGCAISPARGETRRSYSSSSSSSSSSSRSSSGNDGDNANSDDEEEDEEDGAAYALATRCIAAPPLWRERTSCELCGRGFGLTRYRHHCRSCGGSFCHAHASRTKALPRLGFLTPVKEECQQEEAVQVWVEVRVI